MCKCECCMAIGEGGCTYRRTYYVWMHVPTDKVNQIKITLAESHRASTGGVWRDESHHGAPATSVSGTGRRLPEERAISRVPIAGGTSI